MARTALKVKLNRMKRKQAIAHTQGRKIKHAIRIYNRCELCGRNHGYLRKYGVCRICFRELASTGQIPGVNKSSW